VIARLALLALTACAQSAILELEVGLPALESSMICERCPTIHAVIDARSDLARSGDVQFDDDDDDDEDDIVSFVLSDETTAEPVSIVARATQIEAPLVVRARFCEDGICTIDEPDLRVYFERPFYAGESTHYTVFFSYIPLAPSRLPDVGRCAIRGCTMADAPYCDDEGRHFCE
jgi:hypothetical protein